MVAEDGLEAARWSCLPIKVYALPKYLSFLQTLLKGYSIVYVVLLRSAITIPLLSSSAWVVATTVVEFQVQEYRLKYTFVY